MTLGSAAVGTFALVAWSTADGSFSAGRCGLLKCCTCGDRLKESDDFRVPFCSSFVKQGLFLISGESNEIFMLWINFHIKLDPFIVRGN